MKEFMIIIMAMFINFCYANDNAYSTKNYTVVKKHSENVKGNKITETIQLILKSDSEDDDKLLLTFKSENLMPHLNVKISDEFLYNDSADDRFTIIEKNDEELILVVSKDGLPDRYKFYFKYLNNERDFVLDKVYYLSFIRGCDHSLSAIYRLNANQFNRLPLAKFDKIDFSELFPVWKNEDIKLEKTQSKEFLDIYNQIVNKYRNKEDFKEDVESLMVYGENKCEPRYYIGNKYFFKKDISKSNDIAFFFEQAGYYEESIYLLEKIIEKYPSRTVAYINLGDAYWGLKDTDKAKQAYKKYIELMKADNKEQRIPKRIYERVAQED